MEFVAQAVSNTRKCLYSLHQIQHLQASDCKWCGCLQWKCTRPGRGTVCYGTCCPHETDGCCLGTKDPQAEGNMCDFSVSTVWAKTLKLNALFKNLFLLQRRCNWSWRRLALVCPWWFVSEHDKDCPDRIGLHLSVYPTREEGDCLGSNIISLRSSNILMCLQHGKLVS